MNHPEVSQSIRDAINRKDRPSRFIPYNLSLAESSTLRMLVPDLKAKALSIADVHIERMAAHKSDHDLSAIRSQISRYVPRTFAAEFGQSYIDELQHLGKAYADLGLTLEFIFSSAQAHFECIYPLAMQRFHAEPSSVDVTLLIHKVIQWDYRFITRSFIEHACLIPIVVAASKLKTEMSELAECTELLQAGLADLVGSNPQPPRKLQK